MMKSSESISGYKYSNSIESHAHAYLLPAVQAILAKHVSDQPKSSRRIFDLGCGNGSVASYFVGLGYDITGVDPSSTGIEQAKSNFPNLNLTIGSAYDPLEQSFGTFPIVMSLEVVEHVYAPRDYAKTVCRLTESQGIAVISTPYHSYFKNLSLAITGKMDRHFTALWDHGHIKFWSVKTLCELFSEQGMVCERVIRVGRVPILAKSMILVFRKP